MSKPFPCCCKCWNCSTKPESIELVASVISGDNCCNHPNGTYVVGGASNSVFDSSDDYLFALNAGGFSNVKTPCSWTWKYKQVKSSSCSGSVLTDLGDVSGAIDYISQCQHEAVGSTDTMVVMTDLLVNVRWHRSFPAPGSGRRILVSIYRRYLGYQCTGSSANLVMTLTSTDQYYSAALDCNSLPSSISHTQRLKSVLGVNISSSGDTYTHGPSGIVYTLCPAIASVDVNYA